MFFVLLFWHWDHSELQKRDLKSSIVGTKPLNYFSKSQTIDQVTQFFFQRQMKTINYTANSYWLLTFQKVRLYMNLSPKSNS